jgi:hypothetical protein
VAVRMRTISNAVPVASYIDNCTIAVVSSNASGSGIAAVYSLANSGLASNTLSIRGSTISAAALLPGPPPLAIINGSPSNVIYVYNSDISCKSTNLFSAGGKIFAYYCRLSNMSNDTASVYLNQCTDDTFERSVFGGVNGIGVGTNVAHAKLHVAGSVICTTNYVYYVNATSWVAQTATINNLLTVRNSNSVITVITNIWTP